MVVRRTLWNAIAATIATSSKSLLHREISLVCADGTKLAAQSWLRKTADPPTHHHGIRHVLCLHGWLDNCRSFYQLSPALAETGDYHVIALDLPGHGRSSHKSIDAPPMVQAELAFYVSEAIDELYDQGIWNDAYRDDGGGRDRSVTLVGHSLGAGISSLYASCFPEQIDQLILLDGAGFLPREANDISLHVRSHIRRRKMTLRKASPKNPKRGYPTLEAAIQHRLQSVKAMPGNQSLAHDVARELVLRAMHIDGSSDGQPLESPLVFRHDSRFAWPNIQYVTKEQSEGIFRELGKSQVDTCILLAEEGWPFRQEFIKTAVELIKPRMIRTLPGSHYLHADPETAPRVIEAVLEFLSKQEVVDK